MRNLLRSIIVLICIGSINSTFAQVTHISNDGLLTLGEGLLNLSQKTATTDDAIDILAIYRTTAGVAANGIGGSILFRNEASNGGLAQAARITCFAENAVLPNTSQALRFDVYTGASSLPANFTYLNPNGFGIGTTLPAAMLDVDGGFNPMIVRGTSPMYMSIYEDGTYRGYWGSYAGATTDVDFGTGGSNPTGKLHLTIQATPKVTVDNNNRVGILTQAPGTVLDVQGEVSATTHLISATTNYSGFSDVRAVQGNSVPEPGYGYGGHFIGGYRGVYAEADGEGYTGSVRALFAEANGSTSTNYAVYANATNGIANWAGYFASGNVYVTNELRIGSGAINGYSGYKMVVDGKIVSEELRIQNSAAWPDYVFADDYELMDLTEVEQAIKTNKHLPGIPAAAVVDAEGIAVGDMQIRMMEKIEELTLYLIQQQKLIDTQADAIKELQSKVSAIGN